MPKRDLERIAIALENIQSFLVSQFGPQMKELKPRKTSARKTDGSTVWDQYSISYFRRYKIEPIRNVRVNSQCMSLVKMLGVTDACFLVDYFLTRNDAFYQQSRHPIGLCVQQVQKLMTEMKTGDEMTQSRARQIEQHEETDSSIRNYLAKEDAGDALL